MAIKWVVTALIWLMALSGSAAAHELTVSQVDVRLDREATRLVVRLPVKALMHEDPTLLLAGIAEQALRSSPLPPDVAASLRKLLVDRLRVFSDGTAVPLTVDSTRHAQDDVTLVVSAPPIQGVLHVEANLFPDDSLHKVFVNVYRGDALAGQYALDRQNPALTLAAPERPLKDMLTTFVKLGIHHIFIGLDHILFVFALILLGGSLWSLCAIVTAFTLSHSITLALATLNVLQFPSRLVESAIALSIIVVGLHDLRQLRRDGTLPVGHDLRVPFACGFGLVHGFGFASVLSEFELPKYAVAWSLAAFNAGVEIGQLALVLLAGPMLAAFKRYAPPRVVKLNLIAMACTIVAAGGYWLWMRTVGA